VGQLFLSPDAVYLQEGRGFRECHEKITSVLFIVGVSGFLTGGAAGDSFLKYYGLKKAGDYRNAWTWILWLFIADGWYFFQQYDHGGLSHWR
jgi:hypothetical protein